MILQSQVVTQVQRLVVDCEEMEKYMVPSAIDNLPRN